MALLFPYKVSLAHFRKRLKWIFPRQIRNPTAQHHSLVMVRHRGIDHAESRPSAIFMRLIYCHRSPSWILQRRASSRCNIYEKMALKFVIFSKFWRFVKSLDITNTFIGSASNGSILPDQNIRNHDHTRCRSCSNEGNSPSPADVSPIVTPRVGKSH